MKGHGHFLTGLVGANPADLQLSVGGRGAVVAGTLEAAFDSASRNRGLLGRPGLPRGAALIIAPCNAVHTFGMQFPIDVIYASRAGRIVKLRRNLRPTRISAALGAFAVIEMAIGEIDRAALEVGEALVLTSVPTPTASAGTSATQ